MKLIIAVLTVLLSLAQLPAHAAEAGRDYIVLSYPQPVSVKRGQVEVLEFFWYRCDHCFNLEPALEDWAKKQAKDVVFKRVPAVLNPGWMPMARAYYALEALGLVDKLHHEVFDAIHVKGMDLNSPEAFFDWAVTKGVDRRKIADAYHGFSVDTQVMRAQQQTRSYAVNGVPAMVVNGKYFTSAAIAGSEKALFKTIDALIAMERKQGKARK
jgi:protein dithiol oxidoreductase (disulfide-forming)